MRFDMMLSNCPARAAWLAGVFVWVGLGALMPAIAHAQEDVWVPEIPLTRDQSTSARALGMGGAYLAISDDAGGLQYNPAGLARVTRPEMSGSIMNLNRDIKTHFDGVTMKTTLGRTRVTGLGFVYPIPTYRGSAVVAAGYSAPWLLDREYGRRNYTGTRPADGVAEDIFEEGQVGQWSLAYAVDLSPTLTLGLRTSWIQGSRMQDWVYRDASLNIHDVLDVTLNGVTGALGLQTRVGSWGRAGLVVDLPRWIWIKGSVTDAVSDDSWNIDERMTLPFRVGAGVAATLRELLLTADARFTDWSQIDYLGPLRYDDGERRRLAYAPTWDLHLGAEYLLDLAKSVGVRVRGGAAWEPVPYRVLLTDIETAPGGEGTLIVTPVYREARFDPDRFTVTAGLGLLLQSSLTVDIAYAIGSYTRAADGLAGASSLAEDESEQRLTLSAAFRLE
jgi:long-subunit fatty acid transport protein